MPSSRLNPVVLNESNERYADKPMIHGWMENVRLFDELYVARYQAGGYSYVIENLESDLVKKVALRPEKMDEGDLKALYLVGKSHQALGNDDSAIACFKIIYSQSGFRKHILSDASSTSMLRSRGLKPWLRNSGTTMSTR